MKSFICKINDDLSVDFIDKKDKAVFERLLSSIKATGRDKFKVVIELVEHSKKPSHARIKLLKVMFSKIADISGNDYSTVKETIVHNNLPGKDLSELTDREFNDFLEKVILFANDFFNLNVKFNEETNHIEINTI